MLPRWEKMNAQITAFKTLYPFLHHHNMCSEKNRCGSVLPAHRNQENKWRAKQHQFSKCGSCALSLHPPRGCSVSCSYYVQAPLRTTESEPQRVGSGICSFKLVSIVILKTISPMGKRPNCLHISPLILQLGTGKHIGLEIKVLGFKLCYLAFSNSLNFLWPHLQNGNSAQSCKH